MKGKTLNDLISSMNSGDTYVDVRTEKHPRGEIRGQIKLVWQNKNGQEEK